MVTEERLKRAIALRKDDVFLRSEFARFGSPAQLSCAIRQLIAEGVLVKLSLGVFAKAKLCALTSKPIPVQPLKVLAPLALQKLGVKVRASRAARDTFLVQLSNWPLVSCWIRGVVESPASWASVSSL